MNLSNYYNLNFSLMRYHNWNLSDVENLIPWEREVYVKLITDTIKKENEESENKNG